MFPKRRPKKVEIPHDSLKVLNSKVGMHLRTITMSNTWHPQLEHFAISI